MTVLLTEDLIKSAADVAKLYDPLDAPLLVGSAVWCGAGNDIDVVVLTLDPLSPRPGGVSCCAGSYGTAYMAWRHGDVNVIATDDARIWAGWKLAAKVIMGISAKFLWNKTYRVKLCQILRKIGEENWEPTL